MSASIYDGPSSAMPSLQITSQVVGLQRTDQPHVPSSLRTDDTCVYEFASGRRYGLHPRDVERAILAKPERSRTPEDRVRLAQVRENPQMTPGQIDKIVSWTLRNEIGPSVRTVPSRIEPEKPKHNTLLPDDLEEQIRAARAAIARPCAQDLVWAACALVVFAVWWF